MKIDEARSAPLAQTGAGQGSAGAEEARRKREERRAMESRDEPGGFKGDAVEQERDRLVDEIKNRVREGTYTVDSYKVADKFLREALVGV